MVSILDEGGGSGLGGLGDGLLDGVTGLASGLASAAINLLAAPMFFPAFGCCFTLSLDGFGVVGAFTKVEGLSMELDVETIDEGGENHHQVHLPKGIKWGPVTLSRALAMSSDIFKWMKENSGDGLEAQNNMIKGRNVSITAFSMHSPMDALNSLVPGPLNALLGDLHAPIRTWNIMNAFPTKWEGPHFDVTSWSVVGESLTIVHDGFVEGGLGGITGGIL